MIFNSLKSRLLLTYLLIILVLLVSISIGILITLGNNPLLFRQPLTELQASLEAAISQLLPGSGPGELSLQVQKSAAQTGSRLILFEADGRVITDSNTLPGAHISLKAPLITSDPGEVHFIKDTRGRTWLYTLQQIDERFYLMSATLKPRLPLLLVLRDDLYKPLVRAGAFALLTGILLAILLSKWVEAPLQKLARQSSAVSKGEAHPITPEGPSEIQQLICAFNTMITKLNTNQEAQRDFIANVSHELKTPLTSIQGFAQAILDQKPSPTAETRQSARIILDEALRMHKMVMELLTLARLDAGIIETKTEAVDLQTLLRNVLEMLAPQAQSAGVKLNGDLAAVPPLLADAEHLTRVFGNLVENAIKYSHRGGQVTITCAAQESSIEVHVQDNGRGIPKENLSRVFERFYQLDRARSGGKDHGVGLGLAIAHKYVISMGGSLTVHSEPGQGSDFMVQIPIA
ncbi:MAG: HAMP domain-containing histidine kinase [Anaerolineaceae bacterium]|nr:HAMP domain-containing histidine kinase [Anaerolineaceae bacterium]MBN2677355.1 HAMP domain-containing histidine kinase [Anaerolineaceae bacterium]